MNKEIQKFALKNKLSLISSVDKFSSFTDESILHYVKHTALMKISEYISKSINFQEINEDAMTRNFKSSIYLFNQEELENFVKFIEGKKQI